MQNPLHIEIIEPKSYDKNNSLIMLPQAGSIKVSVREFEIEVKERLEKFTKKYEADLEKEYIQLNAQYEKIKTLPADKQADYLKKRQDYIDKKYEDNKKITIHNKEIKIREELAKEKPYNEIGWVWSTIGKDVKFGNSNLNENISFGTVKLGLHFPEVLEGGGFVWLEPLKQSDTPANKPPQGIFIAAKGTPKILDVQWRLYQKDGNGSQIESGTVKSFGDSVQLHVYTQALYGQDIEVQLMDYVRILKDNELAATERNNGNATNNKKNEEGVQRKLNMLKREVRIYDLQKGEKIPPETKTGRLGENDGDRTKLQWQNTIQKAIFDIYLDPLWKTTYDTIKLYVQVKHSNSGFLKFNDDYLSIEGETIESALSFQGNKPVLIGNDEIQTNIAKFQPCKYLKIILEDGNKKTDIFDWGNPQFNNKIKLYAELVCGEMAEKKRHIAIVLEGLKTEDCVPKKHIGHVIKEINFNGYQIAETKTKATPKKEENKWITKKVESSTSIGVGGIIKYTQKDEPKEEDGGGKFFKTDSKIDFDVWYPYGPMLNPFHVLSYFWLPSLAAEKIRHLCIHTETCCGPHITDIAIYPDIKWSLKIGFDAEENDFKTLKGNDPKYRPRFFRLLGANGMRRQIDNVEKKNEAAKKQYELTDQQKATINRAVEYFEEEAHLPATANKPKATTKNKGSLQELVEVLKRFSISVNAEWNEGSSQMDITQALMEKMYKKFEYIIGLVQQASDTLGGKGEPKKDPAEGSNPDVFIAKHSNDKSKEGLIKELTKEAKEYTILFPKIAMAASWQYKEIDAEKHPTYKNRQGLQILAGIQASPVLGFEVTFHLLDLICRKNPIAFAVLAAVKGLLYILCEKDSKVRLDLIITGQIDIGLEIDHNMLVGFESAAIKSKTSIQAEIDLELKIRLKTELIWGYEAEAKLDVGAGAQVGLGIENKFGIDGTGIYLDNTLIFEGVKFWFHAEAEARLIKTQKDDDEESTILSIGGKIEGEITLAKKELPIPRLYIQEN